MGWMDWLKTGADVFTKIPHGGGATPPIIDEAPNSSSTPWWQTVLNGVKDNVGRTVGTAGDIASGVEKGRAEGRNTENEFNVRQDINRQRAADSYEQALENRAALELKQALSGQDYQGTAYHQALLGALGKNLQDVNFEGVPSDVPVVKFTGGLRPSAIGPEGRAAAALMAEKAMENLRTGLKTTPLPAIERFVPSEYKKGNWIDDVLGGIGTVGKGVDIWNERGQKEKNQEAIDEIRKEVKDANKPKAPAPGVPPDAVMRDANGNPVYADQGDATTPFGGAPQKPSPIGTDPLDWLKIMQTAGG